MIVLKTTPMAHQIAADEKLSRLRVGALDMDMGTGKSLVVMMFASRRQARISRIIWFCPVSLKDTVLHQLRTHLEDPSVYVFDETTRQRTLPRDRTWYVVGTESMSSSRRVQIAANSLIDSRAMVALSESHYIKTHYASRTKWITRVSERSRYRLIETGTMMTQGAQDLFAQFRFLSWEILGYRSPYSFQRNHVEFDPERRGRILRTHNNDYLAAKIAPYTYQVRKDECLTLPDKLYADYRFTMTTAQRELYERAKEEILMDLDPDDFNSTTIYRLFSALQQITCGFWHRIVRDRQGRVSVDEILEAPSRRMDVLLAAAAEIPPGEPVIIWAKYLRCLDEIAAALERDFSGQGSVIYTGESNERQRASALTRWRSGEFRFFLATPGSGGHGLTLNESAYALHYTNSFNWAERRQCEDRNHRIGQTRRPLYGDVICQDSIDVRIAECLARKGNVIEEFRRNVGRVRDKKSLQQALKEL